MINRLRVLIQSDPWLFVPTAVMAFAALFLVLLSIPLGLASSKSPSAPGFLSVAKINWALFPVFFVILGVLARASWSLYVRAWRSLPESGVLIRKRVVVKDPSALDPLIEQLTARRPYLAGLSVVLGLVLTVIDAGCLWSEYGMLDQAAACAEMDFTVAYRLTNEFGDVSKAHNGLFVLAAYALQGGLIALAWFALLQICAHGFYLAYFESLNFPASQKLSLRLNIRDPLREFGLSEVNRAINTTYILVAAGMLLPVLSAAGQQPGLADLGQLLLRWLLPLMLLVPLIVPLADRYFRLREASERVRQGGDRADAEEFSKQQLWPFERTQIAYLGKALAAFAVVEYAYVLGRNAADLLKKLPFLG